jgi:hypothetical protein
MKITGSHVTLWIVQFAYGICNKGLAKNKITKFNSS